MEASQSPWPAGITRGRWPPSPWNWKSVTWSSVALIGHRIAHGGTLFSESTLITAEVIEQIRQVSPLAPLHNYANLNGVEAAQQGLARATGN